MNIDIRALSHQIKEIRDGFARDCENGLEDRADYREYLRDELDGRTHLWRRRRPRNADDLYIEMKNAQARANVAGAGATDAQIALIMRLSIEANDFSELGNHLLTKASASRIIDMLRTKA